MPKTRVTEFSKMLTLILVIIEALSTLACVRCDDIYPLPYTDQQLATKLHCQEKETQYFQYASSTKLWGDIGGKIVLTADVALHCLGDDKDGEYKDTALKYIAEISNLVVEPKRAIFGINAAAPIREKRDVKDFFTNTWNKVKKFFKRVFRGEAGTEAAPAARGPTVTDQKDVLAEEEESDLVTMYSVPFQFLQLADGSVPEVRFAENEINDTRIRNFKRHLVDVFATQLNFNPRPENLIEKTVTGEHQSTYDITINNESNVKFSGLAFQRVQEPVVIVKKRVTGKDIVELAPTEALNDRDKMELNLEQLQVFSGGKMVSSSGTSSVVLLPDFTTKKTRRKRDSEFDLTLKFHAESSFDMKVIRRRKRSAEEDKRVAFHSNLAFLPTSRYAEKQENTERTKIRKLQNSLQNVSQIIEDLVVNQDSDYDEKLQIVSEMVEREVSLDADHEADSVSKAVRDILTRQGVIQSMCSQNFSICKDFLQLLVLAGGPEAEQMLLSFLTRNSSLSKGEQQVVANLLADFSKPSANFLNSLVDIISQKQVDQDTIGSLCLSGGSLGSKAEDSEKRRIAKMLLDILRESKERCLNDLLFLDVLEAIGNLGCSSTVQEVLEACIKCSDSSTQIACTHALRQHCHFSSVQLWMEEATKNGDCDVIDSVVGTLLDKIHEQETSGDSISWPRIGFNHVDENLKNHLKSNCSAEDTVRYFGRKRDITANSISQRHFHPEAELWNPGSRYRQKRALWDDLNCNEWKEDNKYRPIQDKEEFATDRQLYNQRKSCLAYRRLGIKGANAEIYAGMFAGVKDPSDPPKYKLFTKFVSALNILDNTMEIGSFYFYHYGGRTKAYVRILGKTRQQFTHDGCTPTDLTYRPVKHIPLYQISLANFQISLGIHLSSQMALNTTCPNDDTYEIQPMTRIRIGGEALGTVVGGRGGVSLGGNFNYKLLFSFKPLPQMCLKGSHGYDPMSISIETFYQVWNVAKRDWGPHRVWRPSWLSWEFLKGDLHPWFDETCIRTDKVPIEGDSTSLDVERELE